MTDETHDAVYQAFNAIRKHSPNPPKLNRPAAKMRVEPPTLRGNSQREPVSAQDAEKLVAGLIRSRRSGIPSGPDGRRRRRGLEIPSLGARIKKEVHQRGWEPDLAHGWIMGHWDVLVGERIAAHTQPTKIEDQVVHVSCDNSNWATELRYLQRPILQKIAEKIGPDIIAEMRIHGPKQHRNYEGRMWVKRQGSDDTYG